MSGFSLLQLECIFTLAFYCPHDPTNSDPKVEHDISNILLAKFNDNLQCDKEQGLNVIIYMCVHLLHFKS